MTCMTAFGSFVSWVSADLGSDRKSSQRAWQSRGQSKSLTKLIVPKKKTLLQVRAVSTERNPAIPSKRSRRDENIGGEFYVDRSCINCDTCRWMAPTVFLEKGGQSAVQHQPTSGDERLQALQALLACPTSSIHTVIPPKDIIEAQKSFPLPVHAKLPGIYYSGYHSVKAFGATTYFITRPEGNILVDSPRYSEQLASRLEDLGGVRYLFLTHRDDVADHKKWQSRFSLERILHEDEVTPDTADVETKLKGVGNWTLGADIDLIFTPGHTEAHVCLLLKEEGVLFTGDHCWATPNGDFMLGLYNKYSKSLQVDSLEALIPYEFTWVLPGHGRRRQFHSVQEKNDVFAEVVSREKSDQNILEHK